MKNTVLVIFCWAQLFFWGGFLAGRITAPRMIQKVPDQAEWRPPEAMEPEKPLSFVW